ncbi:ribonuclease P protein component [uncultured Gammaproteobacteria bacterium]
MFCPGVAPRAVSGCRPEPAPVPSARKPDQDSASEQSVARAVPEGAAGGDSVSSTDLVLLGRLTRRPQFLAVAGNRRKWAAPGIIVQVRRRDSGVGTQVEGPQVGVVDAVTAKGHNGGKGKVAVAGEVRLGLTASRKVGNAVARNRARRRMRAAAREVLAEGAAPGYDVVAIARLETLTRGFADLKADLAVALHRLGAWRGPPPLAGKPGAKKPWVSKSGSGKPGTAKTKARGPVR